MPKQPRPTADPYIVDHLAELARAESSPATMRARREVLTRFAVVTGDLISATPADAEAWWAAIGELAVASRVAYLSHVRAFYRWTRRMELRADDPTRRIRGPRLTRRRPRPIPHPVVLDVIAELEYRIERGSGFELVDVIVVELMGFAGLRCTEVAGLAREDCDGQTVRVLGKGNLERLVPIPVDLGRRILALPAGPIVRNRRTGTATTAGAVSKRYNRVLTVLSAGGTSHQLRHHYGTELYRATRDLLLVGRLMGHARPATSAGYIEPDDTGTRAAVEHIADRRSGQTRAAGRCPHCDGDDQSPDRLAS